jgi:hypothetical protein
VRRILTLTSLLACCGLAVGCKPKEDAAPPPQGKPVWEYTSGQEGSRQTFYASLRSTNAPQGGGAAILTLIKHKGDTYADNTAPVIVLKSGRFHCSGPAGDGACQVAMTVDARAPQAVNGFDVGCGAGQCLMISAPAERGLTPQGEPLIDVLRNAKAITLELPLYRLGDFAYRFDTAGLKWSRQNDRR